MARVYTGPPRRASRPPSPWSIGSRSPSTAGGHVYRQVRAHVSGHRPVPLAPIERLHLLGPEPRAPSCDHRLCHPTRIRTAVVPPPGPRCCRHRGRAAGRRSDLRLRPSASAARPTGRPAPGRPPPSTGPTSAPRRRWPTARRAEARWPPGCSASRSSAAAAFVACGRAACRPTGDRPCGRGQGGRAGRPGEFDACGRSIRATTVNASTLDELTPTSGRPVLRRTARHRARPVGPGRCRSRDLPPAWTRPRWPSSSCPGSDSVPRPSAQPASTSRAGWTTWPSPAARSCSRISTPSTSSATVPPPSGRSRMIEPWPQLVAPALTAVGGRPVRRAGDRRRRARRPVTTLADSDVSPAARLSVSHQVDATATRWPGWPATLVPYGTSGASS